MGVVTKFNGNSFIELVFKFIDLNLLIKYEDKENLKKILVDMGGKKLENRQFHFRLFHSNGIVWDTPEDYMKSLDADEEN